MRLLAQFLPECLGHRDAAAHDDDVDVLRGTFEEEVAHVSAHGVALQSQLVGRLGDFVEDGFVESFDEVLLRQFYHCLSVFLK